MPVYLKKVGKKYCALDAQGKMRKGRCHPTRAKARAQVQAINISLKKAGKI